MLPKNRGAQRSVFMCVSGALFCPDHVRRNAGGPAAAHASQLQSLCLPRLIAEAVSCYRSMTHVGIVRRFLDQAKDMGVQIMPVKPSLPKRRSHRVRLEE